MEFSFWVYMLVEQTNQFTKESGLLGLKFSDIANQFLYETVHDNLQGFFSTYKYISMILTHLIRLSDRRLKSRSKTITINIGYV